MGPTLAEIENAADVLSTVTVTTPVLELSQARWAGLLPDADVTVKLELFQQTGSFKARGAYLGIAGLDASARAAGVVAASGGNHAMAVAWAAKAAGVDALITMPQATDPARIDGCKALGATVRLCGDMPEAFGVMEEEAAKGRFLMHPFEGAHMTLGSAVIGREFVKQTDGIEVFVIPIGGGGLISGMACAIKQLRPNAQVIGVEPVGADSMFQSFVAGHPVRIERIDTIADSLGAPLAMPYSFDVARAYVDEIVHVTDDEMIGGMRAYRDAISLQAEPACAASLAAVCGPLSDRLDRQRVGIIACGSNIGAARFRQLLGE